MDFVAPKKTFQGADTYQLLPSEYFTFFKYDASLVSWTLRQVFETLNFAVELS